jgi:hypothetical protein
VSDLHTDWHNLRWDLERSVLYHSRREATIGRLQRMTKWASVFFGATAVGTLMSDYQVIAKLSAAIVAGMSAWDLISGFSAQERLHQDLRSKFGELLSQMQSEPSQKVLYDLCRRKVLVETSEPPAYRMLDLDCHNQLIRARGHGPVYDVPWYSRWTREVLHWNSKAADEIPQRAIDTRPKPVKGWDPPVRVAQAPPIDPEAIATPTATVSSMSVSVTKRSESE